MLAARNVAKMRPGPSDRPATKKSAQSRTRRPTHVPSTIRPIEYAISRTRRASRRPARRRCRGKADSGNLGRDYTGGARPAAAFPEKHQRTNGGRISVYMRRILVTNDDGYFSPGIEALAAALARARRGDDRRAAERSECGRTRAHPAAAAAARADSRACLLRRRHADRLRQRRHRRSARRSARPRRLGHQPRPECRRRCDVFRHRRRGPRRRAPWVSGDRGVAAVHERGVALRTRGRHGGRARGRDPRKAAAAAHVPERQRPARARQRASA